MKLADLLNIMSDNLYFNLRIGEEEYPINVKTAKRFLSDEARHMYVDKIEEEDRPFGSLRIVLK